MAKKSLSDIAKDINKNHGENALIRLDEIEFDAPRIPTGILAVDSILGGGLPKGKIAVIWGKEGCLASDTFLKYQSRHKDGSPSNNKGGTIQDLYEKFHRKGRFSNFNLDVDFYLQSVNEEDRIITNRIVDVVYSGFKRVYEVRSSTGLTIKTTLDHKFLTKDNEYKPLSDLIVGDIIKIHNNTRFTKDSENETSKAIERKCFYVKSHPVARVKVIDDKYRYHVLRRSRAVIEASMNNLSLEDYIDLLNASMLDGLTFLDKDLEVHHIDEDVLNDDISNLEIVTKSDHAREHAYDRHNNLRFISVEDTIESINYIGDEDTYDIKMNAPYHNFIAEGFVVHNSGKSSLATMFAGQAQKEGKVVYIDLENSFDPNKALNSGVDMDELFISQPRSAEETLEVIEACLEADDVSAIIVDSVAAMATEAQIAGDYSDQHVAGLARVLSLGMNKINQYMIENRKDTILLFVNQVRDIIGVPGGFGPTTTTPGGRALKFYASTILEAARIGNVTRAEKVIGQTTQITVKKSRFSAPFQKAAYDILFDSGISNESTVVDLATKAGRLEKNKGWYTDLRTGEKFNGKANLLEAIAANPEYAQELYDEALTTIR